MEYIPDLCEQYKKRMINTEAFVARLYAEFKDYAWIKDALSISSLSSKEYGVVCKLINSREKQIDFQQIFGRK